MKIKHPKINYYWNIFFKLFHFFENTLNWINATNRYIFLLDTAYVLLKEELESQGSPLTQNFMPANLC